MPSMTASPSIVVGGEHVGRHAAANADATPVAEVRQDAQPDACRLASVGEAIGHGLGDGVDEVRAHRVAAVDEDVHDDHRVVGSPSGRTSRSRAPPPRATRPGHGADRRSARISSFAARIARARALAIAARR